MAFISSNIPMCQLNDWSDVIRYIQVEFQTRHLSKSMHTQIKKVEVLKLLFTTTIGWLHAIYHYFRFKIYIIARGEPVLEAFLNFDFVELWSLIRSQSGNYPICFRQNLHSVKERMKAHTHTQLRVKASGKSLPRDSYAWQSYERSVFKKLQMNI